MTFFFQTYSTLAKKLVYRKHIVWSMSEQYSGNAFFQIFSVPLLCVERLHFFGNVTFIHEYAISFLLKCHCFYWGFDKTVLSNYKVFCTEKTKTTIKPTTIPSLPWRLDLWKGQPETNKKFPDPATGEDKTGLAGWGKKKKWTRFQNLCNLYLQLGQWVSWLGKSDKV